MAARKPAKSERKPRATKSKAPAKSKAAKPRAPAKPKAAKPKPPAKPKAPAKAKAPRTARKLPNPDAPRDQARATHAHPELRTLPEVRAYLAGVVDGRRRGRR